MANVDMLSKRKMLQLLSIIYDNTTRLRPDRVVLHNTRLANKNNIEIHNCIRGHITI